MKRKIIEIDKNKCNGCGQCVSACHEGAIQMIDGKAQLISDIYCDGLGACIGECPAGAINIIEREAMAFDENAVKTKEKKKENHSQCSCPGLAFKSFPDKKREETSNSSEAQSELTQWPIQLKLVPISAPYWDGSSLLIAADCTAFSLGYFHNKLLKNKKLIIACPKLDDTTSYIEKITDILSLNKIKDITIAFMEVPCCRGLVSIVTEAVSNSGKTIPVNLVKISLDGKIL